MNLSKLRETVEDRGAWRVAVHGVAKSWTQLSAWTTKTNALIGDRLDKLWLSPTIGIHAFFFFSCSSFKEAKACFRYWQGILSKLHWVLEIKIKGYRTVGIIYAIKNIYLHEWTCGCLYTLLYLKQITNKDLCIAHGSLDGRGVLRENGFMYMMAESHCCSTKTITTLLIGYTPIQNKKFIYIYI